MRGNRLCALKGGKCEDLLCVGDTFTGLHTVPQTCDTLPQSWTRQDPECQMWEALSTKRYYLQVQL